MAFRQLAFATVVVASLSSCGGKPAVAPVPRARERAPLVVVPPPPLTRVAAPPELFAVARVTNPGKLADTATAWSGLALDWRKLLSREAPEFERLLVTGAPLDFAAMLDPASTLEPRVLYAFSFGVSSADSVAAFFRKQGGGVTEVDGAAFRARIGDSLVCLAGPALGVAPARVVCSDEAEGVDALAPYLSRGLPTESLGPSEIHAELRAEPFSRRYRAQIPVIRTLGVPFLMHELALADDGFDRVLAETLNAGAEELIALAHDLDRIDLDVAVAGNDATVSLELGLSGAESFVSRSITRAKADEGPPPDLFWNLPAETVHASFVRGPAPELMKPLSAGITALVDAWLEHYGLPDARRAPLVDSLGGLLAASPRVVFAAAPPAAAPLTGQRNVPGLAELASDERTWVLDSGSDQVLKLSSSVVKALSDRKFRERLVQGNVVTADELPSVRERAPRKTKDAPKGARVFELEFTEPKSPPERTPAKAPAKAPAGKTSPKTAARTGSKKAAVAAAPAKKMPRVAAPQPLRLLFVVVPDGARCWLAFGIDESALFERIRILRAAGGTRTLASREGLEALREVPTIGGGFSSLEGLLGGVAAGMGFGPGSWSRLPHHGESPILWRTLVGAEGPKLRIEGQLPRATVEDLVALAAQRGLF